MFVARDRQDAAHLNDPGRLDLSGRLKFLAKDSVIYGGAAAVTRAMGLVTLPLLARHFSVEDYGLIDLFTVVANVVALLIVFGQDSAVARYYYDGNDPAYRKRVVGQSLFIQLVVATIAVPVLFALREPIAGALHGNEEARLLLALVILQAPFLAVSNFASNLLKWTFRRARYLLVSLGQVALNLVLLAAGIFVLDMDVTGVFVIALGCQVLFAAVALWLVRDMIGWPLPAVHVGSLLFYAAPLGVIAGLSAFVPLLERALVAGLLGELDLGLYAVGTKIAMMLMLLVQAFQMAWGPFSLAIHRETDAAATYSAVLIGFTVAILAAALALSAMAGPLIAVLASGRYEAAASLVFPLALALAVQGIGWITEIGISLAKRSYLQIPGYLAYLVVTVGAIYTLTPPLGLSGVAVGVLLGQVAKVAVSTVLSQHAYPIAWPLARVAALVVAGATLGAAATWVGGMGLPAGIAAHGVAIMTILTLAWFSVLDVQHRSLGIALLRRLTRRGAMPS